jgi:hypothetical protein
MIFDRDEASKWSVSETVGRLPSLVVLSLSAPSWHEK